jgi:hypothetical protein
MLVVRPSRLHVFAVWPSGLYGQAGRLHHKIASEPRRNIAVGDLDRSRRPRDRPLGRHARMVNLHEGESHPRRNAIRPNRGTTTPVDSYPCAGASRSAPMLLVRADAGQSAGAVGSEFCRSRSISTGAVGTDEICQAEFTRQGQRRLSVGGAFQSFRLRSRRASGRQRRMAPRRPLLRRAPSSAQAARGYAASVGRKSSEFAQEGTSAISVFVIPVAKSRVLTG